MYGPDATSGGVATHTKWLTEELSKLGVVVILHMCSGSNIKKIYQRTIGLFLKAIKTRSSYDIIHIQASGGLTGFIPAISGSIVSKIVGRPLIVTFHYSQTGAFVQRFETLFAYVLRATKRMILVSNNQRDAILTVLPEYSPKLVVVPNGFNRALFHPNDNDLCRDKLGIPHDKKILFNISNIMPTKGHRFLIFAMEELLKVRNDIICYVGGEGPIKRDLVELVRSKNLVQYVKFVGWIPSDEIAVWMNSCDLFVHPSLYESFGIVQVEAMACGKPVVATRNGGSEGIITSDEYGFLADPADPEDLAKRILQALDREWNREAILRYAGQYTWENVAKQTLGVYTEVKP